MTKLLKKLFDNSIIKRVYIPILFLILMFNGTFIIGLPYRESSAENSVGNVNPNTSYHSSVVNTTIGGKIIPGEFIVTFKKNTAMHINNNVSEFISSFNSVNTTATNNGFKIISTYPNIGAVLIKTNQDPTNISASEIDKRINILQNNPNIAFIENNRIVQAFTQSTSTGITRIDAERNSITPINENVQGSPIDATIAILDSGIDNFHPDLNVVNSISCLGRNNEGQFTCVPVSNPDDNCGHGTHVAGTAAAKDDNIGVVGVAPGARIWAIKVLEYQPQIHLCIGTVGSILAGLDYIIGHANEIDAANMSFGELGITQKEIDTVNQAVDSGIIMVVAAGNDHSDSNTYSPASASKAITVGAITDSDGKCGGLGPVILASNGSGGMTANPDDSFASYSNYGKIDMLAPGTNINSTYPNAGYAILSGTSMAAPHVTGAVALYKSEHHNASPQQIKEALFNMASNSTTICNGKGKGYLVDTSKDLGENRGTEGLSNVIKLIH
jgi:subtilisin